MINGFKGYGKTPRLFRDIVITEKVDGTNGGILIQTYDEVAPDVDPQIDRGEVVYVEPEDDGMCYVVRAQSRNRVVYPSNDNFGFGLWVHENAASLVEDLGPGMHFGEWCGRGIQRGYGLKDRWFFLFNTSVEEGMGGFVTPYLGSVPQLYSGPFSWEAVRNALDFIAEGSLVAFGAGPGEGVVVYHAASRQVYKVLVESDHLSKSEAGLA